MESEHAATLQQHMGKLYFYALKKTGRKEDAEDLAQEIAAQALLSLAHGCVPHQFSHWLWGVARHCYAEWVKRQRRAAEWGRTDGRAAESILDPSLSAEDRLVLGESIAMLKRELSLLAVDYRHITVAYYIHGDKIPAIAQKLNMPEGTIKRKLYESRRQLKEGMNMARELGQRSFAAEQVSFVRSGSDGKNGSPWAYIQRRIPKNILLSAYRNPMSLEELCLDLGIAMPYMEEEVKLLFDQTLLKEVGGGKYETDFIIVNQETQSRIFHRLEDLSRAFCPLLLSMLDSTLESVRAIGFTGCGKRSEELYWTLLPYAVDRLSLLTAAAKRVPQERTERPGNGRWDITGYEFCALPYPTFVGLNGNGGDAAAMWAYKINMNGLSERAGELYSAEVAVLANALRSNDLLGLQSHSEKPIVRKLTERGFLLEEDGALHPSFLVFTTVQEQELIERLEEAPLFPELLRMMELYYDFIYEEIGRLAPARLGEQLKFAASQYISDFRMMSLRHALECSRIEIPEQIGRSTIGMYLRLGDPAGSAG
ncbi:RNA polymerase sigma factor [Paenibacillus ginsengarvi]|uniref:Sigma-70 family RNA polymerase sigma factor n=1 Tax=Paenibacillus ginsengarvi TaxID=400777 RepID=A0A3B0CKI5_9BACL|nr:sigma-70 family RNA polymerase sigma factor [Paenibacillus ginsengarvi]RKN84847.1 sigma-70 family RNA polymerase sigma factor [Paenibacillus ginsengarvi]